MGVAEIVNRLNEMYGATRIRYLDIYKYAVEFEVIGVAKYSVDTETGHVMEIVGEDFQHTARSVHVQARLRGCKRDDAGVLRAVS
jgi:hypothetical protein